MFSSFFAKIGLGSAEEDVKPVEAVEVKSDALVIADTEEARAMNLLKQCGFIDAPDSSEISQELQDLIKSRVQELPGLCKSLSFIHELYYQGRKLNEPVSDGYKADVKQELRREIPEFLAAFPRGGAMKWVPDTISTIQVPRYGMRK